MAVTSFEFLCAGFCEAAGVPLPRLKADERGIVAFHVTWRGVTVDVLHHPERSPEHCFVLVTYGAPADVADTAEAMAPRLLQLLDSNFTSLRAHSRTFACNPVTHDVVSQQAIPLSDATPTGLFDLVDRGVSAALQWRAGRSDTRAADLVIADFA